MAATGGAWAGPFDVRGRLPDQAVVTVGEELPKREGARSAMVDELDGVLAVLDKKGMARLRGCVAGGKPLPLAAGARRMCVIHLGVGDEDKRAVVYVEADGGYLVVEEVEGREGQDGKEVTGALISVPTSSTQTHEPVRGARLSGVKFAVFAAEWPAYRGGWDGAVGDLKPGVVAALSNPKTPGWFVIDGAVFKERILRGLPHKVPGAERVLADETLYVRLPAGHRATLAAGVLVWVHPVERGPLPKVLFDAADELGLIVVGAEVTGNDRPRADRYQLALDGVATVCERYLVDRRRVYISGFSGGGKISTHLWLWFPEVFQGVVPVGALATYEGVPAGPGMVWPMDFAKPAGLMMNQAKGKRCGVMTGPPDFNYQPIVNGIKVIRGDGLNVRLFEYADMAHELPRSERFLEVMRWVDEPYREVRAGEEKAAREALENVRRDGGLKPGSTEWKRALVGVTEVGPWTEAAWEAVEMLGEGR